MHGLGNDFVIIDNRFLNVNITTHLVNKLSDRNIHKFGTSSDFVKKYEDKALQIKLGQGLFFDKHLVHCGGLNVTDRTRFGLVTLYHSMSKPNFTPYYLSHPKSTISPDDFFDEVILDKNINND